MRRSSDLIGVEDFDRRLSDQVAKRLPERVRHRFRHVTQAIIGPELPQPVASAGFELAKEADELALLMQLELCPNMIDEAPRIEHRSEEHTSELQSLMSISFPVFSS